MLKEVHLCCRCMLLLAIVLGLNSGCAAARKGAKQSSSPVMSELELQSNLMSFADRSASVLIAALEEFDAQGPTPEARKFVMSDISYTLSATYTIAAEPNPQTALLDLTVVMAMGRSIYEDNVREKYGDQIEPLISAFETLENDIWRISRQVLTPEQQQELRGHIQSWRTNNPDLVVYNYIRFSDFDASRRDSTLVERSQGGGLFKSVRQVTEEVEETRMLAERAIFLGTRLPLLTGHFAEVWMSQLMVNPEARQVLSYLHQLAELSARLVEVTDSLPRQIADEQTVIIDRVMADVTELSQGTVEDVMGKVAVERSQAIDQFMSRLAAERTQTLRELGAEQQELNEIVGNLNVALKEGHSLVTALDQLAVKLRLDQPADPDAAPFNIRDYRDTLAEASQAARELTGLVESTDRSVASGNVQQLLPQLEVVLDRAESESEELVSHVFRLGILLILIWMVGYVASRLIYNYLAGRLWRETPNK